MYTHFSYLIFFIIKILLVLNIFFECIVDRFVMRIYIYLKYKCIRFAYMFALFLSTNKHSNSTVLLLIRHRYCIRRVFLPHESAGGNIKPVQQVIFARFIITAVL